MPDIVETFGAAVDDLAGAKPRAAGSLLLAGFKLKRLQTRRLPDRALLPSGQAGARLALEGVVDALDHPNKAVVTSIFLPNEPFLAVGLKPVTAEALADFTTGAKAEEGFVRAAEEAGVPQTYCSFHKVLLGYAASGALPSVPMVADCSVACDANTSTFRRLARQLGSAHAYVDVPYTYDDEACAYVADQLREMARTAEDAYGTRLDAAALRNHVARTQQTLDALVRGITRRAGRYLQTDMALDLQQCLALHLSLGTKDALDMALQMERDFAAAAPYEGINLVWMHTMPFFSPSMSQMLDRSPQAQVLASDMCFDQVSFEGWDHGPDAPWEAMAERLLKNAFNGPGRRRVERVRELAERTQADGVVCFCHWGCKETMGISQVAKRELEAAGYPVLVLDGDCCHRANNAEGQVSTRLGAFLEMLAGRKERGAK